MSLNPSLGVSAATFEASIRQRKLSYSMIFITRVFKCVDDEANHGGILFQDPVHFSFNMYVFANRRDIANLDQKPLRRKFVRAIKI